jgi:YVTN family beta-propeller protein
VVLGPILSVPGSPGGIAISARHSKLYVTLQPNGVAVLETTKGSSITTISIDDPFDVAISDQLDLVLVVANSSNTLWVVDPASDRVVDKVAVGQGPEAITVNSKGIVFVANFRGNTVSAVDVATRKVIANISVAQGPTAIAMDERTNRVYVTCSDANSVSVIDGSSLSVIATVPVGTAPEDVALDPSRDRLYVANADSKSVSVIDATRNVVTDEIAVPDGAEALAAIPNDEIAVAGSSNPVIFIDARTLRSVGRLNVGDEPNGFGFDVKEHRLYVSNARSNTISVLDFRQ